MPSPKPLLRYQCRQNGCKFMSRTQCDLRRGVVPKESLSVAQKQTLYMIDLSYCRACKGPISWKVPFVKPEKTARQIEVVDPYAPRVCPKCHEVRRNVEFHRGRAYCTSCHNENNREYRRRVKAKKEAHATKAATQ